jgi:hypothetical protein
MTARSALAVIAFVAAALPVHRATSQRSLQLPDPRARVLVAGQPDSASLALTAAIRQRLQEDAPSLLFIPQATFDAVLLEGYRAREDPIAFTDMREVGMLVRADLVIGFIPDSVHQDSLDVLIATPRGRTPRKVGRWRAERGSATGIVEKIEADSAYDYVRKNPPKRVAYVRPPEPKPLPVADRAEVRVRILDLATSRYFAGEHVLDTPLDTLGRHSWKYGYTTSGDSAGWGRFFWLPPGTYAVEFERFDCSGHYAALRRPVRESFDAKAGDTVQITLRVNLDTVALSRTYDNVDSLPCRDLRQRPRKVK